MPESESCLSYVRRRPAAAIGREVPKPPGAAVIPIDPPLGAYLRILASATNGLVVRAPEPTFGRGTCCTLINWITDRSGNRRRMLRRT